MSTSTLSRWHSASELRGYKLIRGDYRDSNPNYQSHSLGCYHYNIATPNKSNKRLAPRPGIEPGVTESKSVVLPLHHRGTK